MKLFPLLAAAALTLGAAPAQAIDVGALIDVATLQTRNGEYARACKTMTFVEGEAAKQGVSATNQATIRDLAAKACKLAAATPVATATVDPIKAACLNKWGTDYQMVAYCWKTQTEAKRALGL